jgi:hypothetical protein
MTIARQRSVTGQGTPFTKSPCMKTIMPVELEQATFYGQLVRFMIRKEVLMKSLIRTADSCITMLV